MVVDAVAPLTINVLGEAHAYLAAVRQLDSETGIWYSLYPEGQQGYCHVGKTCWLNFRIINDGLVAGTVYVKVTQADINQEIFNQNFSLQPGEFADVSENGPNFVMPAYNMTLNIEIGHY